VAPAISILSSSRRACCYAIVGKLQYCPLQWPMYSVYGVWCMVCDVWRMVYGVWCMVYGVYGVWCMVYGVWCMVCMVCDDYHCIGLCIMCMVCMVCDVWCMVYDDYHCIGLCMYKASSLSINSAIVYA
jgi:hypothetical protein